MMLKPEPIHPTSRAWKSAPVSPDTVLTGEPTQVDALVESLMPEGVSANKRAVIDRLITIWSARQQAASKLDIA